MVLIRFGTPSLLWLVTAIRTNQILPKRYTVACNLGFSFQEERISW